MATQSIAELFNLGGKGAVVTGGAMGIGQAIALRLAEAGASVMIAENGGGDRIRRRESSGNSSRCQ
jgi:NAD(P)-dependent dehydrogenase (short-subunit alcohol dehydrogenase family)